MKRRNFIKGVGLVGAAAYVNPFSFLTQKPFQVGDIVEIERRSAGYHDGILRWSLNDYFHSSGKYTNNNNVVTAGGGQLKGLRLIENVDPGGRDNDNWETWKYEIMDLKSIRKDIIDYAAKLEKQLEYYIDDDCGTMDEDAHEDGYTCEYYELCALCILIDDKKLWDSIYKSEIVQYHYGPNGDGNYGYGWDGYDYFADEWNEQKYGHEYTYGSDNHKVFYGPMIRRVG